jgi:hypothetical protein
MGRLVLMLVFSDDERAVLDEIRRAGAFRTTEDAIKGALFWYARFLDIPVQVETFALSLPPAMRTTATAPAPDQGGLFDEDGP